MPLEIIGSVLALGLSVYFIFMILHKKTSIRIKDEVVALLKNYGSVNVEGKNIQFKSKKKIYTVLLFNVSLNSELTINSQTKWEVRAKGQSLVIDQEQFLSSDLPKLVIVHPTMQPIKRYINENEMVFVKPQDQIYQMNIMLKTELEKALSGGIL